MLMAFKQGLDLTFSETGINIFFYIYIYCKENKFDLLTSLFCFCVMIAVYL